MHLRQRVVCLASLCLAACSFTPNGGDNTDAAEVDGATDAAEVDTAITDAAEIDTPAIDAPVIDAPAIDAATIDAATIDGAAIDAPATDAAVIDAPVIDAAVIDAAVDAAIDARIDAPIDAPIDARPNCPGYVTSYNGATYALRTGGQSFPNARTDCENDVVGRTHLATFENPADLAGLFTQLSIQTNQTLWIGTHCTGTCMDTAASWLWHSSGMVVATSLWETGEPSNTNAAVGAARFANGRWGLADFSTTTTSRPYVCECEP